MLLTVVVFAVTQQARAACEIARPFTSPLPTMPAGQTLSFVANNDCETLSFRAQGGALVKTPIEDGVVAPGRHRYVVPITAAEWDQVERSGNLTFTWTVTGTFVGTLVRLTTTNEIDADMDGWTRSEGDAGACDHNAARNPEATEICDNGIDDDCDGAADLCDVSLADADLLIEGESATSSGRPALGERVATAIADLDGDGVADLLFGDANTSEAYVVYGAASGVVGVGSGTVLNRPPGSGYFGWGVGAGDASGDGVGDVLVSAPEEPVESVFLFLGPITTSRDAADADAVLLGRRSGLDGSTLPGTINLIGPDLDGDAQPDIVVGAEDYGETRGAPDVGALTGGALYVVPGDVTGTVVLEKDAPYRYTGVRGGSGLGHSLPAVGDWNNDGIDDLAVACEGNAYIIDGGGAEGSFRVDDVASATVRDVSAESLAAADYDGDGESDLFAGSAFARDDAGTRLGVVTAFLGPIRARTSVNDADTTWEGTGEGDYGSLLGWSVATDDFDADGATDVAMADGSGNGSVYVQLGRASGTVLVAELLTLTSDDPSGQIVSVAGIPDWTGDGGAELLIGAPGVSLTGSDAAGAAYVFFSDSLFP